MKYSTLIATFILVTASFAAAADEAACDKIMQANVKTGSSGGQMKSTGYAFAKDTPALYGLGDHTCRYLRDEPVDGKPAAVYLEEYKASKGSTVATIWISKTTGRLLREEQDGDIAGKGKGHISYRWASKP